MKKYRIEPNRPDPVFFSFREFISVIEKTEKESIQDIKILLAEDNELNQEVARILLEEEGAKVFCVNNGQKAVEAFSTHPAGSYDLILMDSQK